jgi:hypothetical protein
MSVSPPLWSWAVEDDEPQMGTEEALIRQLASGRLPPYALVWREGWGEWLPAMQVEELAEAFPDVGTVGTRTARPSSIPGVPPVPVSEYPRLRHLAKAAPLGWPDGFEYREQDVITSEVPAVVMKEAARVMTQPTPPVDLGLHAAIERHSRRPEELTPFIPPGHEVTPVSQRVRSSALDDTPASERAPASVSERAPASGAPGSGPARPLAAEYGLQGLIDEEPPRENWPLWWRANGLWVALLLVALGVAAAFALRHFGLAHFTLTRGGPAALESTRLESSPRGAELGSAVSAPVPAEPPQQAAGALAAAPAAAAALLPVCQFRHPPLQLDDWAVVDVRPLLRELPSAGGLGAVAVGYAESHRSAAGGTLDVESLRLTRQFWEQEDRQIFSVTPLVQGKTVAFHVERQGSSVAFGRALDTNPPLRVGMNDDGLVSGQLDQRSQRLWALPAGAMMSVAEVGQHSRGLILASRAGRSFGHVRLGLLDPSGQPRSPLVELGEEDTDYGRPGLASGPEQTLVAVARRADTRKTSALFLARSPNGQLPTELLPFPLPASTAADPAVANPAPDPELLAPVVGALPDGRFALMWSQGAAGVRHVRLQILSATLQPLGAAFDVTAPDPALGAATAAALHWASDRLLAFFFVRRDDGHSLWVGSIGCS